MNDHSAAHYVFHIALIEIRAIENPEKARTIADVMHNVPMMIRAGRTEAEIAAEVIQKAKRQGLEECQNRENQSLCGLAASCKTSRTGAPFFLP